MFRGIIFVFVFCLAFFFFCCSSQHNESPVIPGDGPFVESNILSSDRLVLTAGNIRFDPESMLVEFVPNRNALAHWNGTPLLSPPNCDDCITVELLEFKPDENYIQIRVSLRNPTQLIAYEVRGIIMSNNPGIRLINADSYTALWDDGGDVEINPFKAFETGWYNRMFLPNETHSTIYEISYPELDALMEISLVIDASWPGYCKEPYEVGNASASGPFFDYNPQTIEVKAKSWADDISLVSINLSCLGYEDEIVMTQKSSSWWATEPLSWKQGGQGPGQYRALVSAKTSGSAIFTYNYVEITIEASQPTIGWALNWGGENTNTWASDVAISNTDDLYVVGYFVDTVDFDPGPGVEEHDGSMSGYFSKFNTTGEFQWVRTWEEESIRTESIAVDNDGNIYCAGYFWGVVDFDPGPGIDEIDATGYGGFLCKFDSYGNYLWARNWGGEDVEIHAKSVAADPDGNIYVTGGFNKTVDFDPGIGLDEHTADGTCDASLIKFASNGDYQWVRCWGGWGKSKYYHVQGDYGFGVATDLTGGVYVTGRFDTTADFDPGVGEDLHTASGAFDIYLTKYNEGGSFLWAKHWGGGTSTMWGIYDYGNDVYVTTSGNVYVTGKFWGTVDFDPGPDISEYSSSGPFLSCFDVDGSFNWACIWPGQVGYKIAVDNSENIYVSGLYPDLVKIDSSGVLLWTRAWGGGYPPFPDSEFAAGVDIDSEGNVYTAGVFTGTLDFNPGPGIYEITAIGELDTFLSKFDTNGMW